MTMMNKDKVHVDNVESRNTHNDNLQLPIDVVIKIMSYLSISDRISASSINRMWYEASLSSEFLDKQVFILDGQKIVNVDKVIRTLRESTRPFYHIIFKNMDLNGISPIWEHLGSHIKTLILTHCNLVERNLVDILRYCDCLETFHIESCRECFMSGRLLSNENDVKELSGKFQKLCELSLAYNPYLSDAIFNRLVTIFPNLESLSLMASYLTVQTALCKKPYSQVINYPSESILTFSNLLNYIERQAKKLKHLNFGYTFLHGAALTDLFTIEDLKLESLKLHDCSQLTMSGIKDLTDYQKDLRVLDIGLCSQIGDIELLLICSNLSKLEKLNIRRCKDVSNHGIQFIKLLKKLRELDISECKQLTGESIAGLRCDRYDLEEYVNRLRYERNIILDPMIMDKNSIWKNSASLEKLSAQALNIDEEAVECIANRYQNLKFLDISYCFNAVTNKSIQVILKGLTLLQVLKIDHCDKLSDAGFIGIGINNDSDRKNSNVEPLRDSTESRIKISLGSRAEKEILRDAKRKLEVIKLYEEHLKSSVTQDMSSGVSLTRLKNLKEFCLSRCNGITDVSLKHAFVFPELTSIDLSYCYQITDIGLNSLAKNNPSIENLDLSECHNITNVGICHIVQRLHRLKELHLQGCSQLTDRTLDVIKLHCKKLRYLNVKKCNGMSAMSMKDLRDICMVDWKRIDEF